MFVINILDEKLGAWHQVTVEAVGVRVNGTLIGDDHSERPLVKFAKKLERAFDHYEAELEGYDLDSLSNNG